MKRIVFIATFLFVAGVSLASASFIDAVSGSAVGTNAYDMNGMEITVTLSDDTTETRTWNNNIASGTGWVLDFNNGLGGANTGSFLLNWSLRAEGIKNITIDAYASSRILFDNVYQYPSGSTGSMEPGYNEGTYLSDTGLWGPNLYTGTGSSGLVSSTLGNNIFLPSSTAYGHAFYWEFSNPIYLNSYPPAYPQPGAQDLYGSLFIDFVNRNLGNDATLLSGEFKFAVDTDFVAGRENPVPEPATLLLFGVGLLGLSAVGRKKA